MSGGRGLFGLGRIASAAALLVRHAGNNGVRFLSVLGSFLDSIVIDFFLFFFGFCQPNFWFRWSVFFWGRRDGADNVHF